MNDADKKLLELAEKATNGLELAEKSIGALRYELDASVWGDVERNLRPLFLLGTAANAVPRLIAEKEALLRLLRRCCERFSPHELLREHIENALAADDAAAKEPADE